MGRMTQAAAKTKRSMGFGIQMQAAGSTDVQHIATDGSSKTRMQRLASKCLHTTAFENLMAAVIVSNIFVMVIETDMSAEDKQSSSSTSHWTEKFGWAVLCIFALELFLRLFAFRWSFWMDGWNIFDFIIVCTDVTVGLISLLFGKAFPVTTLRIFRLAKLARVSKVLRVFPELRLLLASLLHSISAIFWGAVLLGVVLLVWSMIAVLVIHPLNKHLDYDDCQRCPRAYSSVFHSSLTFWQTIVTTDNWGESTIPLIERFPSTAIFFIPLYLSVGMAVVSLILGMVVSVAQRAEAEIREVENAQETALKFERQSNLLKLCKKMDTDKSGEVSQSELLTGFEEPGEFRDSMEALGITRDDFDVVWAILDTDNTGQVSYKRLVSRLYALKTSSSQFTLAYLKYHITLIRDILMQMEEKHTKAEEQIEQQLHKVEKAEEQIEQQLHKVENQEESLFERQEQLLEKLQAGACDESFQVGDALRGGVHDAAGKQDRDLRNNQQATDGGMPVTAKGSESCAVAATSDAPEKHGQSQGNDKLPMIEEATEGAEPRIASAMSDVAEKGQGNDKLPLIEEISDFTFVSDILAQLEDNHVAEIQKEHSKHQGLRRVDTKEELLLERLEELLEKLQAAACDACEKEYKAWGIDRLREEVSEVVKRQEPWTQDSAKLNGNLVDASASRIDEAVLLLAKVGGDINRLRLELNDRFTNLDYKLGLQAPSLSAMERHIMGKEAQLELLVVPERAPACSLCPRCIDTEPTTQTHALSTLL